MICIFYGIMLLWMLEVGAVKYHFYYDPRHPLPVKPVSYTHLDVYKRQAQERVDTMLPHMMETAGVTEELKACDPMRWVGLMNTLTAQIEEILIRELICSCLLYTSRCV